MRSRTKLSNLKRWFLCRNQMLSINLQSLNNQLLGLLDKNCKGKQFVKVWCKYSRNCSLSSKIGTSKMEISSKSNIKWITFSTISKPMRHWRRSMMSWITNKIYSFRQQPGPLVAKIHSKSMNSCCLKNRSVYRKTNNTSKNRPFLTAKYKSKKLMLPESRNTFKIVKIKNMKLLKSSMLLIFWVKMNKLRNSEKVSFCNRLKKNFRIIVKNNSNNYTTRNTSQILWVWSRIGCL